MLIKKQIIIYFVTALISFPLLALAKQKVLIIESYHSEYAWDKSYINGIKSVFKGDYELLYFQMDTKRLPKTAYQERANKAWLYFQRTKPDLVILGDDNALDYLGTRFSKTLTPIIYLGINNNPRRYHIYQSKNIVGVLERPLIKRAIPIVVQLFPNKITRILLMFDDSLTSHTILEEVFSSNTQIMISGIKVEIRLIGDWQTWQAELLSTANRYDAVFFGLFHTLKDKDNNHIPANKVLNWSAKHTPIPPFGFWDFSIGTDKAIGGLVLFGYEQGKMAAEMAKEVLVNKIPPYQIGSKTAEKGRYLFSRKALKKYGLTLPQKMANKTEFID